MTKIEWSVIHCLASMDTLTTTFQWLPLYHLAVYLGLLAALGVSLWLARRWATSPVARGWLPIILRTVVLGVLVVLLLNPIRVSENRSPPKPAEVIFLVDCSRSMSLDRPLSRLVQVKQALEVTSRPFSGSVPPQIHQYRFGRQVLAAATPAELRAEDDATFLRESLERLPGRFGSDRPAGVIVFSDGRTEETGGFAEVAAAYRELGVPVHVYPVGDTNVVGDVAIQELVVPRHAPAGTRLPVRVQVGCYGMAGQRALVRVQPAAQPDAKPLAELPITLADTPQTHDLVIGPDLAGGDLVIEVPELPGEAVAENNRVPFRIGSGQKKLRVIYMEATTGQEYRFVRDALVEDRNNECLVIETAYQYTRPQRLQRVGDPSQGYPTTREELFSYDVILCSDIDRSAFTPEQLNWTVELVAERGGGFAMIGGVTSFGAGLWDQTVWDQIIPVDMSGAAPGSRGAGWAYTPFLVRVPAEAEQHPIWRIVDDPLRNREILARLPQFYGTNLVDRVKPGGTVLGVTDRQLPGAGGIMPVFACQAYGRGRTFAMTPDTTFDWGKDFERYWGENDNRYFRKFWRNVVSWLGENSAQGSRRLRIETDKQIYRWRKPPSIAWSPSCARPDPKRSPPRASLKPPSKRSP
ncbi:MAG: glutamine amidotransferase [Pirellulaceae bacterium]|nr:glutamine amidotransferase [Pirellulaceae bacterium]